MQETNLKVSPYFDDFDRTKNYQKVLFKPGYSVQTRELNTIQSTLQNQIERFGQHVFKDGSVVIPGNVGYNLEYNAVLIQNLVNGLQVEEYRESLVGTTITGVSSGVKALIIDTLSQQDSEKNTITLYVQYTSGGFFEGDQQLNKFKNNEVLVNDDSIPVAVTTVQNSTAYTGSVAYINPGVYFIRGFFVEVGAQRVILDQYNNKPSYKVGLIVRESIVTSEDDETLFDNALGSTNYSSPGADRLQISTVLSKQNLLLSDDSNFIELLRMEEGNVVKLVEYSAYNELEKSLARRTFDESGSYTLKPYGIKIREALFNGENDGVYFANQVLQDGTRILDRDPTDDETTSINGNDYYALEISEGKAYVKGFEVNNTKKQYVIAEKPRKSSSVINQGAFLNIGRYFNLDNNEGISGKVRFGDTVLLKDVDDETIGTAKCLGLTFGYRLYITDLTVYTKIVLSTSSHLLTSGDLVTGVNSGATGIVESFSGSTITLRQVAGSFLSSESITSSKVIYQGSPVIVSVDLPRVENIRKIEKTGFSAYTKLDSISISGTSFSVSGTSLTGINTKFSSEVFAKSKLLIGTTSVEVNSVSSTAVTLNSSPSVSNGVYYNVSKLICKLYDSNNGMTVRASTYPLKSTSDISYDVAVCEEHTAFNGGFVISKPPNEFVDSTTVIVTSSTSLLTPVVEQTTANSVTVSGLSVPDSTVLNVYYKLRISNATSRTKQSVKYQKLIVDLVKDSTNTVYGTRLSDKEWSLRFPDVYKIHRIHESISPTSTTNEMFDTLELNDLTGVVVGDVLTSGSIRARIIEIQTNLVKVIYLSDEKFTQGSNLAISVSFSTNADLVGRFIKNSEYGIYRDITENFTLMRNDTEDFYRVSKLVRKTNRPIPVNRVIVVFDYLSHGNLSSDFYTPDSYIDIEYSEIPNYYNGVSYSDLIDFRYYVAPTGTGSGTLASPHRENSSALDYKSNQILSTTKFAYPQRLMTLDYDFYLGRIDKVYLNETGYVTIIKGADSITPKLPLDNNTSLLLGTITLPAYLKKVSDASITIENTKGYTMKDIGLLDQRLSNVETYTSLNLLEVNTNNLNITDDEGRNRFKNGFVVDKFNSVTIADLSNPDYSASIDTEEYLVRPYPYVNNISFWTSDDSAAITVIDETGQISNLQVSENTTKTTGDVITIPYEEVVYIQQRYSSRVENLNPFEVVNWVGNITLTPKKDVWYDTVRTFEEGQTIDLEGPIRFLFDRSGAAGDQWGSWTTTGSARTGGGTNVFQNRTGVNNRLDVTQQTIETGDTINSIVDVKFVRPSVIDIRGSALKPNTNFNLYINNINSTDNFYPKIITGLTGVNKKFVVGETVALIRLSGNNSRVSRDNWIYATVVNPYDFTSNTSFIGTNFSLNQTSQKIEYSQSTTLIAIDKVRGSVLADTQSFTNSVRGSLGDRFQIVGLSSGARATCGSRPNVLTNEFGQLDGFVVLPRDTFETGTLTFSVSDRSDNIVATGYSSSNASTSYFAQGATVNVTSSIVSVSVPEVVVTPITENRTVFVPDPPPPPPAPPPAPPNRSDPLAQSFFVETQGGVFVTSLDLYFYTKDDTAPVTIDIRTIENGIPTEVVLPYSTVTLQASDIKISTDASEPTKFTFQSPVYLSSQTDYCFVARSASKNYYIWVSRLGEIDVTTNFAIDKQPYLGVLFKSANQSTWISDQYEDIKFTLHRAKFATNTTYQAYLYNNTVPSIKLISDSLSFSSGSAGITVFQPNHAMHSVQNYVTISGVVSDVSDCILDSTISNTTDTIVINDLSNNSFDFTSLTTWTKRNNKSISQSNPGFLKIEDEIISFSGIQGNNTFTIVERGALGTTASQHSAGSIVECYMINGIPLDQINTKHKIVGALNFDQYQIIALDKANSDMSSGGTDIYASRNIQYETINPEINILNLPDTNSSILLDSVTATSIGNETQTSFLLKQGEALENNSENDLTSPRLIASETNREQYLAGLNGTMRVTVNMSTSTDNLSPVLDVQGSSIITINNRINKITNNGELDLSSELLPVGGLHSSYITKKVVLENSSTSIRVLFDAIRMQNVDIKVFAKVRGDSALGSFSDMNYIEIPVESYPVSQTRDEYRSFEYEITGLPEFKEWNIKVVLISDDQSNIPKIKNFRAIALAI